MSKTIVYFGAHREPAVLVTDFNELTEGVILWCSSRDLSVCCDKHECRTMVMGDSGRRCVCGNRSVRITACDGKPTCLCPDNVANGEVYRVIDEPPANTETRARAREREDVL